MSIWTETQGGKIQMSVCSNRHGDQKSDYSTLNGLMGVNSMKQTSALFSY